MEPSERFEIQLSHVCNNRCVFCVSGQMTELRMAKPTPLPEVKARFDEARARGITKATIMGGEPTIHPTFFPTVEYALELGFETIVIFTNGARLDKQAFIDRIMNLGKDRLQWRISIQGWDRETHDFTTKKPGAFAKIIAGLETLTALGQYISCNMCVVEQNYRSLLKLPEMVTRYPIRQVHLDMVRPRDSGVRSEDYLDGIIPDYADLGRVLRQMFAQLDEIAPGFDINIGNLPFCQLPDWAHRIHHGGNTTYTVSAEAPGKLSVVAWDKYDDKRSDKLKLESCGSCVFERRCDGFFDLYARRRGTDQFLPVSREKLRRSDPTQRTFVHQIDAGLVAMARERFAGWRLHSADDSEFDRWARQTWTHADGGRARLSFLPRDAPADASGLRGDVEHRDFVIRVDHWRGVEAAQIIELLDGVAARVAEVLGHAQLHAPPSLERFLIRRNLPSRRPAPAPDDRRRDLAAPLLSGLVRLAAGLGEHGPLAPWTLASTHVRDDRSVDVRFAGPRGASCSLALSCSPAGQLAGKWAFGPGHEQAKRQLALGVTQLLRPPQTTAKPRPAASAARATTPTLR